MTITLNRQQQQFAEERARQLGYESAAAYVSDLIQREQAQQAEPEQSETTRQWLERIRGTARTDLTTDQILEMSRSEV